MPYWEQQELDEGIKKHGRRKNITALEKKELTHLIDVLILNEKGRFKKTKDLFKKFNIDWRVYFKDGI